MINVLEDSLEMTSFSCKGTDYFPIFQTAKFAIVVIQIAVPFIIIIWGSLDWFKALIAHDEREMREKRKPFFQRVIFAILVLMLPALLQRISLGLAGETEENNFWKCYFEAKPIIDFSSSSSTKTKVVKKKCTDYSLTECPTSDDYGLLCKADTDFNNKCDFLVAYNKIKTEKEKENRQNIVSINGKNGSGPSQNVDDRVYGAANGSTVISYYGANYVVVDTKYPGGVVGFQQMIKNNGVYQSALKGKVDGAGGCCGGISQLHACALKKGMSITINNVNKNKGSCNDSNIKGCSGSWSKKNCFDDETSFVRYVIENVQKGNPVIIETIGDKTKKGTTRHFLTVVGFREGSHGTSYEDFLVLDSYSAYIKPITETKRIILGKGIPLVNSDNICGKNEKNHAVAITN